MRRTVLVVGVLLARQAVAAAPACLGMRISADRSIVSEGEPIRISVFMKNACDRDVVILDTRWSLSRVYDCSVFYSSGRQVSGAMEHSGPARIEALEIQKYQKVLKSGREYRFRSTLADLTYPAVVLATGTYSVSCAYMMPEDEEIRRTPLADQMWFGTIRSNAIEFSIMKRRKNA